MARVNVEDILRIIEERKKINSLKLDEIEWYKDGKEVNVPKEMIDDFKFTGLCNTDFIMSDIFSAESK